MTGLQILTLVHVAISLAAIGSGFVAILGMISGRRPGGLTAFFLATTVATSVTGFFFPITGFTPGIALGILSLVVLAPALYGLYVRHLAGIWRPMFVIGSVLAQYFNVFVLIVQSFQKVPFLHALAPTQGESPFAIVQGVTLLAFLVMGVLAMRGFRGYAAATA